MKVTTTQTDLTLVQKKLTSKPNMTEILKQTFEGNASFNWGDCVGNVSSLRFPTKAEKKPMISVVTLEEQIGSYYHEPVTNSSIGPDDWAVLYGTACYWPKQ